MSTALLLAPAQKPALSIVTTDYNLSRYESSLSPSDLEELMGEDPYTGTHIDIFTYEYSRNPQRFQERLKQAYVGLTDPRAELFGSGLIVKSGHRSIDCRSPLSYNDLCAALLLHLQEMDWIRPFPSGVTSIPLLVNYTMNGARYDGMITQLENLFDVKKTDLFQEDD